MGVTCSMETVVKNIVMRFKLLREYTLNVLITRKIKVYYMWCIEMDVNYTYCGDYFAKYANVKLCCILETYIM